MMVVNKWLLLTGALIVLTPAAARAGETVIYKGSEIYGSASETLTALPTGDAIISEESTVVLTSEASPEGGLKGNCQGVALRTVAGEYQGEFYCLLVETDEDTIILKGTRVDDVGTIRVVGGGGKWQGATGKGSYTINAETGSVSGYALRITTP